MNEKAKGARPDIKLGVKNKLTGERVYWASGWRGDLGVNLAIDKRATLLIDGVAVSFGREGTHYFDMFENEPGSQGGAQEQRAKSAKPAEPTQVAFDDSDIPF